MVTPVFPNGLISWIDAHYEVASAISGRVRAETPSALIDAKMQKEGFAGMYELAVEVTNEFEQKYAGHVWDGEYWDTIESFLNIKLK